MRQRYDDYLGEGYSKTDARTLVAQEFNVCVETASGNIKDFIPANNYTGVKKSKLKEPTA